MISNIALYEWGLWHPNRRFEVHEVICGFNLSTLILIFLSVDAGSFYPCIVQLPLYTAASWLHKAFFWKDSDICRGIKTMGTNSNLISFIVTHLDTFVSSIPTYRTRMPFNNVYTLVSQTVWNNCLDNRMEKIDLFAVSRYSFHTVLLWQIISINRHIYFDISIWLWPNSISIFNPLFPIFFQGIN